MTTPPRLGGAASRLIDGAVRVMGAPLPPDVRVVSVLDEAPPARSGGAEGERVLVLDWLGTHRDARVPLLRAAWHVEEAARAAGAQGAQGSQGSHVLVLRLAPLVGPASPLMAWLARRPRLAPRLERAIVQPVLESDVVASLAAALSGRAPWSGWFEACGPEPLSVGELAALAAARGAHAFSAPAACEPSEAILAAQGLAEWGPWSAAFGLVPGEVAGGTALGSVA